MPMSRSERQQFRTVVNDSFLLATPDMLAIAGTRAATVTYAALESVSKDGAGDRFPHELSIPDIIGLQGPIHGQSPNTVSKCMRILSSRGVIRFDTSRHGRDNRYRFWMDRQRISQLVENPELPFIDEGTGGTGGGTPVAPAIGSAKLVEQPQSCETGIAKLVDPVSQNCDTGLVNVRDLPYRDLREEKESSSSEKEKIIVPKTRQFPEKQILESSVAVEIRRTVANCQIPEDAKRELAIGNMTRAVEAIPEEARQKVLSHLQTLIQKIRSGEKRGVTSWGYLVEAVRNESQASTLASNNNDSQSTPASASTHVSREATSTVTEHPEAKANARHSENENMSFQSNLREFLEMFPDHEQAACWREQLAKQVARKRPGSENSRARAASAG